MINNDNIFLSIIIPAYNEGDYIACCLNSINILREQNLNIEVIVVDNGSTDNTVEICESYGSKVLIKKEGTISSLRNYGANASQGGLVAFLDADCILSDDWLQKSLAYLKEMENIILGFRLIIPENSNWVSKCWDLLFVDRYSNGEVDWVPTGNMVMTRDTFTLVGGFNESLETNEDYDFCFRAKAEGAKIISSSDTSVIHLRPPKSLAGIFKKELWHGKEVFKVFVDDLSENRDAALLERKNIKVVAYASFYMACIISSLLFLMAAILTKTAFALVVGLFLGSLFPVMLSFMLAIRYVYPKGTYGLLPGMTVLLTVYGFARALGLLSFSNLKMIWLSFASIKK